MDDIVHNYKRFDGESDDELILRICNDKENIGTWNDVAAVLNSLLDCNYTESAYRKKVQYFRKVLDANQSKFTDGAAQLKELKEERILLEKERVKTRDERNEYRRLIREEARKESYKEQILRSISEYHGQPLDYDKRKQFNGILKSDNDLVISVTDIHAGIEIDNWFNKYNTEVMYALKVTVDKKADKATTLAGYGISDAYNKTEIDGKLKTISDNVNTKVDATTVDSKIAAAKPGILSEAAQSANEALETKVGDLGESETVVDYVNKAVGSGGADVSAQIDEALKQAKQYTDDKLSITEF